MFSHKIQSIISQSSHRLWLSIASIALIGLIIGLTFLWSNQVTTLTDRNQAASTKILVSIEPYRSLVAQLIGPDLDDQFLIELITPPGVEPHDYELTLADRLNLENSDLILVNGRGLEPYLETIKAKPKQKLLVAAEALAAPVNQSLADDPHLWLDPTNLSSVLKELTQALIIIRPDLAERLKEQEQATDLSIAELDQEFKTGLSRCLRPRFITTHQAFAFLAARYQLEQLGMAGLTPEAEPTAEELTSLTATIKARGDQAIFIEPLSTNRAALTLARNLNLKILTLNPIEARTADETAANQDYFDLMRQNLTNLRQGLGCE